MQKIESLQTISYKIRAVAHVLFYADYIQQVTDDADFMGALVSVIADWAYLLADRCQDSFDACDADDLRQSEKLRKLQEQLAGLATGVVDGE